MHPSKPSLQSRLANGRQGSLRASAGPSPLSATFTDNPPSEQAFALIPTSPSGAPSEGLPLASEQENEEFEEITYDELRLSLCPADTAHFAPVFDYQRAYHPSLLSRSRTSLSRLRKLSQASLKKSREVISRPRRRESTGSDHRHTLAVAIRRPSTDSSASSRTSSSLRTPPQSQSTLFLTNDPLRKGERPIEEDHPVVRAVEQIVTEPEDIVLAATPRTPKARSITSSLKRLRTLSKAPLLVGARRHAPQVCQILSAESSGAPARSPSAIESPQIPELVFEHIDLSIVLEEDQPFPSLPVSRIDSVSSSPPDTELPRIEIVKASPRLGPRISSASRQLRLPQFDFVDPLSLAASVPPSAVEGTPLFGSTAPSPSWLSRNVQNLEINSSFPVDVTSNSPAPLPIRPPPSPPLYIVPRSLRPDTYYLRGPEIEFEFATAPQTPQSTSSSLTLYSPSQRASFLAPTSVVGSRPTSHNRLSVIYSQSTVDNRRSIHSVVSYNEEREGQDVIRNTSFNVYVVSSEDTDQPLTPLALGINRRKPSIHSSRPREPWDSCRSAQ
ncbi:hypothetical protein BD310DRAFT_520462 [Dichomitus squalens]|uniref:Uncharacterized protein n=1 Tax=Dichomitus squalens TaxID=114155 RepID=A0A4Q9Q920_9APHY|nr:hypothetical protein BD310DRAFT_520462 [Dichomitus squalens]